ncbi:hypothetical protein [Paenarthrobacter sp. Y-19]|uniref:hypothetical protein n=1 Tax=Paenarthrobacter sp. Y-19 TaxID=3031125 RepID=UPI0023DB3547|nr:hypothetical protein [Paenarthrobacter sp. Y-19]
MKQTIKAPTTIRELGEVAEKLDMGFAEVLDLLTKTLGVNWWNRDHEDFSAESSETSEYSATEQAPPTGYELAPGGTDVWVGAETFARGWIITPTWNSTTRQHAIELWIATNPDETYRQLSPGEAHQLATELTEAVAKIGAQK